LSFPEEKWYRWRCGKGCKTVVFTPFP
jgi:hypothetical protein